MLLQDLSEARLTITGTTDIVPEAESASVKETYRQQHASSFWIDFGDFAMFRMQPLIVRYNYGFATAGQVRVHITSGSNPFYRHAESCPVQLACIDQASSIVWLATSSCIIRYYKSEWAACDHFGLAC